MQQILLSQFSDEEVEIVYLSREQFYDAYEMKLGAQAGESIDMFDQYAKMNRSNNDPRVQARYANEPFKESLRRKLSLSSISQKWTTR